MLKDFVTNNKKRRKKIKWFIKQNKKANCAQTLKGQNSLGKKSIRQTPRLKKRNGK